MKITQLQIKEMAEHLDTGMNVYINPVTGEIESLPNELHHPLVEKELWQEIRDKIDMGWESFKLIEPIDSRESFYIMEAFVETVSNEKLKDRLIHALNRSKPFHNFKYEIDYSGEYHEKWFALKLQSLIEYVKEELDAMEIDYDKE